MTAKTPMTRAWLVQKYWDEQMSLVDIALLKGCCTRTVVNWMDTYGIERRPTGHNIHNANRLPDGVAAMHSLLYGYRRQAVNRGLTWGLSEERFQEITQQPCHYCGDGPANVKRPTGSSGKTGSYIYNGVDRKDNGQGYIEGNVVPCCKTCNWAKGKMGYDEFLAWLDRVATYRNYSGRQTWQ